MNQIQRHNHRIVAFIYIVDSHIFNTVFFHEILEMPPKLKRSLECKVDESNKMPVPTSFASNLCKFHITQSDVQEFSHNFVHKLLIPELLKCTNTTSPVQKARRAPRVTNSVVAKKQSGQTAVPGYRVAQCIDNSSRLSAGSRISPKNAELSTAKSKMAPSKSNLSGKAVAASEKLELAKLSNVAVGSVSTMDGITESNTESALVQASDGNLMISEIIIKFCRSVNDKDV